MGLVTKLRTASTIVNRASTTNYDLVIGSAFPEIDLHWPSGTGDNEANVRWATIANAIANSATETIDLRNLTSAQGDTFLFTEVRLMRIKVDGGALTIAKGGTDGWTGPGSAWSIKVPAGSNIIPIQCGVNGAMSTGASDKTIDISNASGVAATYSIEIVGTLT